MEKEVLFMNKKYLSFRTDMADERVDTYKRVNNLSEIDGIKVENKVEDGVTTTVVDVLNENGKEAVKKDIGRYITIDINETIDLKEDSDKIAKVLSNSINSMIDNDISSGAW